MKCIVFIFKKIRTLEKHLLRSSTIVHLISQISYIQKIKKISKNKRNVKIFKNRKRLLKEWEYRENCKMKDTHLISCKFLIKDITKAGDGK